MRRPPVGNDVSVSAERIAEDRARGVGYGWSEPALRTPRPALAPVSPPATRACLLVRVARITAGAAVTLFGVSLLVLPGPGFAMIAAGLSILSIDVPQAQRLLREVSDRLPQRPDGGTPGWVLAAAGAGLALSVGISATFMLL